MGLKKIADADIIYEPIQVPAQIVEPENPYPTLLSVKRDKTQTNIWTYYGIYSRDLYTRLKLRWLKNVYPRVSDEPK